VDIHRDDANYFWGPAIHWNTHLRQYVILLNRAKNKNWNQEGVYVTFNPRLDAPAAWTPPVKILDGVHYYPQVIGTDVKRRETDKLAGRTARLFVTGPQLAGHPVRHPSAAASSAGPLPRPGGYDKLFRSFPPETCNAISTPHLPDLPACPRGFFT
jgi:hypothetical protein